LIEPRPHLELEAFKSIKSDIERRILNENFRDIAESSDST
jgi:hypothetical protein